MKKFLLTFFSLLGVASYALADNTTIDLSFEAMGQTKWGNSYSGHSYTYKVGNETFATVDFAYFSNQTGTITNIPVGAAKKTQTPTVTVTFSEGINVSEVTFNFQQWNSKTVNVEIFEGDDANSLTTTGQTLTINGKDDYVTASVNSPKVVRADITSSNSGNTQFAISSIDIEYTTGQGQVVEKVATPVIGLVDGEYNTVEITCATEGATILYTVNGEIDEYTGPFTITGITEIEAIAEKEGMNDSNTAKATIYPNMVTSLADFKALANPAAVYINTPITAVASGNKKVYVTDNKGGWAVIYDTDNPTFENGTTWAGLTAVYNLRNSEPQLQNTVYGQASTGTAIEPTEATGAEVNTADAAYNGFFRVNLGELTLSSGKYYLNTPDGEKIYLYDGHKITFPEADATYDVIGYTALYNTTVEFVPVEFIENHTALETVETPEFSLQDGTYNIGEKSFTVTCATEGATIYLSVNAPVDAETPAYDGSAIALDTKGVYTYYAVAKKDGMIASDEATLEVTVIDPESTEGTCTVIFANQELSGDNKYGKNKVVTWTATNGAELATMGFVSGNNSNYPTKYDNNLRLYKTSNNVISVNAPAGYAFVSVTLHSTDANVVTFTEGETDKDVTAKANQVTFTFANNPTEFSFNCNNDANTAKNYNFSSIDIVVDHIPTYTTENANEFPVVYGNNADKYPHNYIVYDEDNDKYVANKIVLTDATTYANAYHVESEDITYNRAYAHTNWQAWYSPIAVPANQFAKVIKLTGANYDSANDEASLEFESVADDAIMEAHVPYLVKPLEAVATEHTPHASIMKLHGAPEEDGAIQINGFTLKGTYTVKTDMFTSGAYAMAGGNFHPAESDEVTLQPFRLYMMLPGSVRSGAKVKMTVDGEDETNALQDAFFEQTEDGTYYDLQGRKVENPQYGIYILNGKKVTVK